MSTATLNKWGNAVGLRIPQAYLEQLNLKAGDKLNIDIDDNVLIVSKAGPTLSELLKKYDKTERHAEAFADPVGRELI